MINNSIGSNNTAVGNNALSNNISGSNNTALGNLANTSLDNLSNATAIGQGAIANASNKMVLGNTAVTLVQTSGTLQSKGLYITADATAKNASAALEVKSTTQGLLPPRMDTAQLFSIATPANGLTVYCTTYKKPVYWDGVDWYFYDGSRVKPLVLGEYYMGGLVYYIDGTGRHGLIVISYPLYVYRSWGPDNRLMNTSTLLGSGEGNTNRIAFNHRYDLPAYPSAASYCDSLVTVDGYSDWYLPSLYETKLLAIAKRSTALTFNQIFDVFNGLYLTSSEYDISNAYAYSVVSQYPEMGTIVTKTSAFGYSFFAIRKF